jgi:hypothetical protein
LTLHWQWITGYGAGSFIDNAVEMDGIREPELIFAFLHLLPYFFI